MKSLIENAVHWNKIGKHSKDSYIYSIEKAVVLKETAALSMDIRLNFIIPFSDTGRICNAIKNEISGLQGVNIIIYMIMLFSQKKKS
ncbi:MAG: hypothetical protein PHE94_01080 [Eubacteriales bacterium]|nr:hypothetical protein [Eubacteriales bacterium]